MNVVDFTNIKSDKLTLYNDILFSEKEGDSGLGIRSQFTYQPTPLVRRSEVFCTLKTLLNLMILDI